MHDNFDYKNNEPKNRPDCKEEERSKTCCRKSVTQHSEVSLPVCLRPFVKVCEVHTECCGEPVVTHNKNRGCDGERACEFTITQNVRVKIDVEFGAETKTGPGSVHCKGNCGGC